MESKFKIVVNCMGRWVTTGGALGRILDAGNFLSHDLGGGPHFVKFHQAIHSISVYITEGILYFNEKVKEKNFLFYFLGIPKV